MTTEKILEREQKRILSKATKKESLSMEEINFLALHEIILELADVNCLLNSINSK